MFKCLKFRNLNLNYKLKYLYKMEVYNNSICCNSTYNLSNLNSTHKFFDCRNLYLYEFNKPTELIQNIQLDEKEKQIFGIIKSILQKHNKNTICRVAGGWVRDKLLGKKNDDIDIALDDMSGESLARLINDELYPGEQKFGIVSQNCEKSKHLETATMKVCGVFIDFVNLRSEKYTEHSRVPEIEIGTPEEDARRRDITINAMFYNINNGVVEDFINSGISDLSNGYIRTPLDPDITFADDPLRILRVIRFAVRFQFILDPLIINAAKKEEIKSALYKKISNERIAKEISLMLEGNKSQCAVYLLYNLNLLDAVLKLPLGSQDIEANMNIDLKNSLNLILVGSAIHEKLNFDNNIFFNKYLFNSNQKEIKKLFYLSLLTLPFKNYFIKVGKENIRASALIIRDSLKLPNDYIREINILHENVDLVSNYIYTFKNKYDRLSSARIIRKIKSCYIHKITIMSVCLDYLKLFYNDEDKNIFDVVDETILIEIIDKYQKWYNYLEQENLLNVDSLEPLIRGDKIVELIGVKGKVIGTLVEYLIENQIINSKLTYEDAIVLLTNKKEELKVGYDSDINNSAKKKNKNK